MKSYYILLILLGLTSAKPTARIVGGKDVDRPGKYPWQGSLQSFNNYHICGAVVISSKYVLSSALCTVNQTPATRKIILGMHDEDTRLLGNPTDYLIEKITNHPNYSPGPPYYWGNDISVLTIQGMIDLNDPYVKAITMADENSPDFTSNENCIMTGWGSLYGFGPYPNILQEANFHVLTREECEISRPGQIFDNHLCIGNKATGGNSFCTADNGGPLACPISAGDWILAGIASIANANCTTQQASLCARVGNPGIRSFIRNITSL
ncbi:unnamed protein product [Dimorphilus gyrociliatus]|uniref:Peptidase S1 domain-containing protein n=1 Tax=Dimorphilus gyrociliatus TaxID=2664684 RepID=A0A7I8VK82_9ANNE|nr:unnamed protein product [Dimorphilus gyrociliatus]